MEPERTIQNLTEYDKIKYNLSLKLICIHCFQQYKTNKGFIRHKKNCLQKKIDELESENKKLKNTNNHYIKIQNNNQEINNELNNTEITI